MIHKAIEKIEVACTLWTMMYVALEECTVLIIL